MKVRPTEARVRITARSTVMLLVGLTGSVRIVEDILADNSLSNKGSKYYDFCRFSDQCCFLLSEVLLEEGVSSKVTNGFLRASDVDTALP